MNGFWDIVKGWSAEWQVLALAIVALFVTIVTCQLLRTVRVVLRGYPPPDPPELPDCNSDDNLTGQCLKPGGCKTQEECDATIAKHNGRTLKIREE